MTTLKHAGNLAFQYTAAWLSLYSSVSCSLNRKEVLLCISSPCQSFLAWDPSSITLWTAATWTQDMNLSGPVPTTTTMLPPSFSPAVMSLPHLSARHATALFFPLTSSSLFSLPLKRMWTHLRCFWLVFVLSSHSPSSPPVADIFILSSFPVCPFLLSASVYCPLSFPQSPVTSQTTRQCTLTAAKMVPSASPAPSSPALQTSSSSSSSSTSSSSSSSCPALQPVR